MVKEETNTKPGKKLKTQALLQLAMFTGILIAVNYIAGVKFARIDLTTDKRFTLSESTKSLAKNLKDIVYIKVYLEGEFSPGLTQLQTATRELLDELNVISDGNVQYEFIDPSGNPDEKERNKLYSQLYQKGIQPTTIEERNKDGINRQYIFPGALVSYSNQEIGVQLLKDQIGAPSHVMLNNSIRNLEFEFSNAIRKATNPLKPAIAFLEGHGELNEMQIADFASSLVNSYDLQRVRIDGKLGSLDKFKALIIAKPDSAFDDKDKFILDQYIMKGGRVLWLIDVMDVTMDSLANSGETIALARDLRLDDMLFKYGVRINYDLVQDMIASMIPVVTGYTGNQPKQQLMPWYYFPVVSPSESHPVSTNLNAVKTQFASSMDTLRNEGVRKAILLSTSRYSKVVPAPVRVSLGIMQFKPDPKMFPLSNIPLGVLLEGNFTSVYKNRVPPEIANDENIGFRDSGSFSKMVVISDGDLIRNDIQRGQPSPLGADRYTGMTYGNKAFLLNVMDYLCDESGLIALRNKENKMRMLDPAIIEEKASAISLINTIVPSALIIFFGIIKFWLRKRKYAG